MEMQLKLSAKNSYPLSGLLVKAADPLVWLAELQFTGLQLQSVRLFPLPGTVANTVWGCLIVPYRQDALDRAELLRGELCQLAAPNLFIPCKTVLHPLAGARELEKLLGNNLHLMHPELGMCELTDEVNWMDLMVLPAAQPVHIVRPAETPVVPGSVKSFQVKPMAAEEAVEQLEQLIPQQVMEEERLSWFDRVRLFVYSTVMSAKTWIIMLQVLLFLACLVLLVLMPGGFALGLIIVVAKALYSNVWKNKNEVAGSSSNTNAHHRKTKKSVPGKGIFSRIKNRLQQDFEELQRKSQKEVERLMRLFEENPEEALKYALPLNDAGTSRNDLPVGSYSMQKLRDGLSLTGAGRQGGGTGVLGQDDYYKLRKQYLDTAAALKKKGKYKEAAFVYLKLLKDYNAAAVTLEEGGVYADAAAIYLQHSQNTLKAAQCYERGNMYREAISLYQVLNDHEKTGDLYLELQMLPEANEYHRIAVAQYASNNQFVKASAIMNKKIQQHDEAQELLLCGWRQNADSFNCINNYFANIKDEALLDQAIKQRFQQDVAPKNARVFLAAMKHEYLKTPVIADTAKRVAYQIVADGLKNDPAIVSELTHFNRENKELLKDIYRFKSRMKE